MEKIAVHIMGEIVYSDDIGKTMKKWREMFGIPQVEISRNLDVSPSVISDYEVGRRKNPGVNIVKKYVNALIALDKEKGGHTIKALKNVLNPTSMNAILQLKEYQNPKTVGKMLEIIGGKIICGESGISHQIFGHTVIDSKKAILEMNGQDFINLYGWTSERALVFTEVSAGRSPMVAIRVSNIKPRVVIFNGVSNLDRLAVKLAELEGITLITTELNTNDLLKKLKEAC
ncbi:helix-turn-helix domain-containing protein [Methanococcus voltae]|uniref:Transcriptional regulator n=2 Tax=Methanococcus voltae TaxID=2188 RepID=A0ABT2EW37_METVO|nr:helix-turn-helix domain-containing protein [Methanococcus voltae]MCS3922178.1 putative transcriptional regulator [Methanococcus voltae PS]